MAQYDLSWLDPEADEQQDFNRAYRVAALTQPQRASLDAERYNQMAVQGVENIGRGILGLGPSQRDRRAQAGLELQELAQRVRPGSPDFYNAAADVFRKHGLVAEADAMANRAINAETGQSEKSEVLRLQRTRDILQKRLDAGDMSVKPALDAIDRRLGQVGTYNPGSAQRGHDLLRLQRALAEETDPQRREEIQQAIQNLLAAKGGEKPMSEYQRESLGLRRQDIEGRAGERADKRAEAQAGTIRALQATVRAFDQSINHATRLLNHPGLWKIVGSRFGATPLEALAAVSGDAGGAAALYRQVQGMTFIGALQELKAQSRTGATGLGQLTEIEGEKIQQAAAALHRQQPVEQFKSTLNNYISSLTSARSVAAGELQRGGGAVPSAPAPVYDNPAANLIDETLGSGRTPGARERAAQPAPQSSRRATDTVFVMTPDGRRHPVRGDRVEEALRRYPGSRIVE